MVSTKKTKRKVKPGLSDQISKKKHNKPVVNVKEKISSNPFEVKINKKKFDILGRKQKEERGLPGVARQKANKKRQETLLPMLKDRYKSSKFIDRRLGEGDTNMSLEEKMMARYAAERAKTSTKKAMFSLEDEVEDTILTHRGQSLAEIERHDDPRSDDDDEEMGDRLGADVTEAHFGGGMLSKKEGGPTPIEQLIADSKKRKDERQKAREETADLTDKLDSEWKGVLGLLGQIKRKADDEQEGQPDDYDVAVKQLRFDARAKPTDKLKTADEVAKEQAEKLRRLEEERMKRMNPDARKKVPVHLSADALDDSYLLPPPKRYQEEEAPENLAKDEVEEPGSGSEEESEAGSDNDDSSGDEDGYSDLESGDENDAASEDEKPKKKSSAKTKVTISDAEVSTALPYVVKVSKSYEEFCALLSPHPPKDKIVLLDRMFRCNHPTLSGENKSKIEMMFKFLIQLVHDLGREAEEGGATVDSAENPCSILPSISTIMFEIIGILPQACSTALKEVVVEHFDEAKRNTGKKPTSLDVILFLKLVGMLCPTSDFRHAVTTPTVILATHLLGGSTVSSFDRVVRGLLLSAVLIEYITLSKRYTPELFNFLRGTLILSAPKCPKAVVQIPQPFRGYGPEATLLVLDQDCSKSSEEIPKLSPKDLRSSETGVTDTQKISALQTSVKLISDCLSLWKDHPSYPELTGMVSDAVERIPTDRYPEAVRKSISELKGKISGRIIRKKLLHDEKRPKMLKLYEPVFQESYDGRRKLKGNPEKVEQLKLSQHYKREMKGAIREIRKDTAFIAREQLKDQQQKDGERRDKVKKLLGSLSMQEGDFKKLKRDKK